MGKVSWPTPSFQGNYFVPVLSVKDGRSQKPSDGRLFKRRRYHARAQARSVLSMPGRSGAADTLDPVEIAVDAAQQIDQDFPFVLLRTDSNLRSRSSAATMNLVMVARPLRSAKSNGCARRPARSGS